MKKILSILALTFSFSAFGYFPLGWTPETLQSIRGGYSDSYGVAGLEVSLHGDKERAFMEEKVGIWGDANYSFSAGVLNKNYTDFQFYGAVHVHLEAFERIGVGIKQFVFYGTGNAEGEKVQGELNYFLFYQFYDLDIIFSDNREYLAVYTGFKSDHFIFNKEDIETYIEKAFDLATISNNVVLGFYYNPDVTLLNGISFGIELNLWSENKTVLGTVYFNI